MTDVATAARPYARAAFEAAQAEAASGALARWEEFLATAAAVVGDERVTPLLDNPRVAPAELVRFVLELTARPAGGHEQNFLSLLAENRRLPLLREIAAQFALMRADAENQADVEVRTAMELTEGQLSRLSQALAERLKRSVRIRQTLDPALIGGAIVRHGDLVFDGSLRGRLERLGTTLTRA